MLLAWKSCWERSQIMSLGKISNLTSSVFSWGSSPADSHHKWPLIQKVCPRHYVIVSTVHAFERNGVGRLHSYHTSDFPGNKGNENGRPKKIKPCCLHVLKTGRPCNTVPPFNHIVLKLFFLFEALRGYNSTTSLLCSDHLLTWIRYAMLAHKVSRHLCQQMVTHFINTGHLFDELTGDQRIPIKGSVIRSFRVFMSLTRTSVWAINRVIMIMIMILMTMLTRIIIW